MARTNFTRRDVLRAGALSGAAGMVTKQAWAQACVDQQPIPISDLSFTGCGVDGEPMATSPFIVQPYKDPLPIPRAMRPGWRYPNGTLAAPGDPNAWTVRKSVQFGAGVVLPGPEAGHQDAFGDRPGVHSELGWGIPNAGTHQQWTSGTGAGGVTLGLPDPLLFHIRVQVSTHGFTTSQVVPITNAGAATTLPTGAQATPAGLVNFFGTQVPSYLLPDSTIYGFNGTFPGPLLNCEYGRPVLVRFENDLDLNPRCLDRGDFGAPDWAFLTHLHNGHTAPESDGQPHHMVENEGGYRPTEWVDNLYLGYPAGGDDREKQSFLWFHDHRMHHTGPNVYKGMVGLAPHYDPVLDNGDETHGLRLPGVRTNNGDGTFDVDYDIPMALYDFRADDGVTQHMDDHTPLTPDPRLPGLVCGNIHPEYWGKLYHRHYPNHGFVGDIFTVNGTAFPTLVVKRRKYRFRFLGASVSRQYRLSIRTGTPMPFPGSQGQWLFGKVVKGKQVTDPGSIAGFIWTQIASEGGLLPNIQRKDDIEIWPAKRREAIVDFSTAPSGAVYYLTNTAQMLDGRKMNQPGDIGFDPNYAVPMMRIVIDGPAVDNSVLPGLKTVLRAPTPFDPAAPKVRDFTLQRGGLGGETQWLINGAQFDPQVPLATPFIGAAEAWGINNGGGGWTHPMHLHMEEHHVISRTTAGLAVNADDTGKEDVVALQPSENTVIFRRFRTFVGNYVAHCHNLAHEDHNMMFGWTIRKP
jgi:FtsP/CotA-like multicopper oxidase with cupredoxin domain